MSCPSKQLVLVTGGTGFIGSWIIVHLLQAGYQVRTTIRDMSRADEVRQSLMSGGRSREQAFSVELSPADLLQDEGWDAACRDCAYVLHVASPLPRQPPKDENELIIPARDGTLRVLKAAKAAGVRRVVVTSTVEAIFFGHPYPQRREFTEADFSRLDNPSVRVPPYPKAKTLAERAAWDWIEAHGGGMELAVVCPSAVAGPLLDKSSISTSVEMFAKMIRGEIPGMPKSWFGVVDVRDVAELHLLAMTAPEAKGQRYAALTDEEYLSGPEVATLLSQSLGDKAPRISIRTIPNWIIRVGAWFDPSLDLLVPYIGKHINLTNKKAKSELGWKPRSAMVAFRATGESLERFGLVKF